MLGHGREIGGAGGGAADHRQSRREAGEGRRADGARCRLLWCRVIGDRGDCEPVKCRY